MSNEKVNNRKVRFGLKRWRKNVFWLLVGLVVFEFPLTVAFLTLIGISDPNTYRTKLWQDGYLNGFNSSPDQPLYAAANYLPSYTPLIWSQGLTTFNLVLSILTTFIWILKIVIVPMHVMYPIISLVLHGLLTGLFGYSIYGQTSHDTIDPAHSNNGLPWYITKSCSVSFNKSNVQYCQMAKATFYISVFLLALFAFHLLLAIHAILFSPQPGQTDEDTNFMAKRFPKFAEGEKVYDVPANSPGGTPWTPRTPAPYSPYTQHARDWEMDRIPPTPGTTGGMKSPMGYAPHAGYATDEAAQNRDRGVSMMGFAPSAENRAYVPAPVPATPRTKAFNALEGEGGAAAGPSDLRKQWEKRQTGNLPWSGRKSGGSYTSN